MRTAFTFMLALQFLVPAVAFSGWVNERIVARDLSTIRSLQMADMDGDGDQDILGPRSEEYEFLWWENADGTGEVLVEHQVPSETGSTAYVIAGDLDGDGDLDLAGVNSHLKWWENLDGTANGWQEHHIDSLNYSNDIRIADINGDGENDILLSDSNNDRIVWWQNDGDSNWTLQVIDALFEGPQKVRAADIDGDGDMDVVGCASDAREVAVWENQEGNGLSWAKVVVHDDFQTVRDVFVADMNGDGHLDILGLSQSHLYWWENATGGGLVWLDREVEADFCCGTAMHVIDIDGDGDTDIFATVTWNDGFLWLENLDGEATSWDVHSLNSWRTGSEVYAADMDGDGDTDMLGASNGQHPSLRWWEQSELFAKPLQLETSWHEGHPAPEHNLRLVFTGTGTMEWEIEENIDWLELGQTGGTLQVGQPLDIPIEMTDYPGPGDYEEVIHISSPDLGETDRMFFTLHATTGIAWVEHYLMEESPAPTRSVLGDFDGDEDTDIMIRMGPPNSGLMNLWTNDEGDATEWSEWPVTDIENVPEVMRVADLNNDGAMDLVGSFYDSPSLRCLLNEEQDGLTWTEIPVIPEGESIVARDVTDIDADGDLDILSITGDEAETVTWFENTDGTGTAWSEHNLEGFPGPLYDVEGEDVNGDGSTDIVLVYDFGDSTGWLENLNAGSDWIFHSIDMNPEKIQLVSGGDFDGDGDTDILMTGLFFSEYLGWWENTSGDGLNWTHHLLTDDISILYYGEPRVDDVDGDGASEFVYISEFDEEIQLWDHTGDPGNGFATIIIGENFEDPQVTGLADMDGDGDLDIVGGSNGWPYRFVYWEQQHSLDVPEWHEADIALPRSFSLNRAYPNPFNPSTSFSVSLPAPAPLEVAVYNLIGQRVATLADGAFQAGKHRFRFDAGALASGMYFVRAVVPGQMDQVRKVVLLR